MDTTRSSRGSVNPPLRSDIAHANVELAYPCQAHNGHKILLKGKDNDAIFIAALAVGAMLREGGPTPTIRVWLPTCSHPTMLAPHQLVTLAINLMPDDEELPF